MNPSPQALKNYLDRNYPDGQYFCVYEAGFCGFWIHKALNELGINTIVTNPADVPTTHKEKTNKSDKIDARKLSRELENNSLKGIFVPQRDQQELRSLCRLRQKTVNHQTRLKNRIKMNLHFYGIELPSRSECSHWSKSFIQWLRSLCSSDSPADYYLNMCIDELEDVRNRLAKITRQLRQYTKNPEINKIITLLLTVPGIGFKAAITIYTELMNIHRFKRFDELASYVGLVPSLASTGDTIIEKGITQRKNCYLRYILIESAWIAIRHDPALFLKFTELTRRMKNQDAIVRIAKKLLSRIRSAWLHEMPYVCSVIE